ncbi:hypothetical protein NG796_03040 [Laspinema sp. A4]|uniref:hypothetical protein n=1 Tax=Laspinema sp. D2d TaxID=2953686 RepID=UPI0021BBABBD|nr:hypothetical protein [Laspinema sp. D2d]MCT7982263.1 hypothetical protein [Laspinema sp. D2d]
MFDFFPIFKIPENATQELEQLGTKYKFWFNHPELGNCLYKQSRPNTGEDWSEKISAELCKLLGLPHAEIELASWNGSRGTVSPSFLPESGRLTLGNEILARMMPEYPKFDSKVSAHTLNVVLNAIHKTQVKRPINWTPPAGIETAVETFIGYLLLDAWIGNSDRHHENWGIIESPEPATGQPISYLAPSYDHASSLGRELLDPNRQQKLNNHAVTAYVNKCRSALYADPEDKYPMKTFDAFGEAKKQYANAALIWLEQLSTVSTADINTLFDKIPGERITPIAISFSQEILTCNKMRLMKLDSF